MIVRLSTKLASKLKVPLTQSLPLNENLLLDWSAHLFIVERHQHILVTNTATLYSVVFYGLGLSDAIKFREAMLKHFELTLERDGLSAAYDQFIEPASHSLQFSKALNRSVTGSMSDLVAHTKFWILERQLCNFEVPRHLNSIPFSALKYLQPRKAMRILLDQELERISH